MSTPTAGIQMNPLHVDIPGELWCTQRSTASVTNKYSEQFSAFEQVSEDT